MTTTAIGPSLEPREVPQMYSLELSRAIAADREHEVARAMRHRRLLAIQAVRPLDPADGGSHPGGRASEPGTPCTPVLGSAR